MLYVFAGREVLRARWPSSAGKNIFRMAIRIEMPEAADLHNASFPNRIPATQLESTSACFHKLEFASRCTLIEDGFYGICYDSKCVFAVTPVFYRNRKAKDEVLCSLGNKGS